MKPPHSRTFGPGTAHVDMSDNSLLANRNYLPLFIVPFVLVHGRDGETEKMYLQKRLHENITLVEKPKCAQCRKNAIGFQSIGYGFKNVCEGHADSHSLALRPGEKHSVGKSCFFERFDTSDT